MSPENQCLLETEGDRYEVLTGKSQKVYGKAWWKTGDKQQCKGSKMYYWVKKGQPELMLEEIGLRPLMMYHDDWDLHVETYQNHLQSGAYWATPGQVVWTDGARRTVTKEKSTYLSVGAGAFSPMHEHLNFTARIFFQR